MESPKFQFHEFIGSELEKLKLIKLIQRGLQPLYLSELKLIFGAWGILRGNEILFLHPKFVVTVNVG